MKYSIQIIFSVVLLIFFSCQNGSTESKGISDAELIQAIIDADKISIGVDDLPSNSKTVIEYDYNEYESESARKAYGLGYEVNMAGKGHKVGSRCEVYFNLDGRRLNPYGRYGDENKDDWDRDKDKGDWKCFDLMLPVTYVMPDGSTLTVENENDWDALKEWYEANPESDEKPEIQFPVNIELDDREGTINVVVNNEEEMRGMYSRCGDQRDDEDGKCFDFILPISYTMPDGSTLTVENENDWDAIKEWYEANPESDERPTLQFPINVEFDDETMTVNSEEELRELKQECWRNESEERECFTLVFPVTFIMPDGSNITVDTDDDAGWQNVKDWYEANPESDERPTLQFPIDIIFETEDGDSTLTVNNDEEMEYLKRSCREEWADDDMEEDEECYEYILPISFTMPDGTTITIEDDEDWFSLREWYANNDESEEEPLLQYPVNIVLFDDENGQSTITINNEEEMNQVEEECWGNDGEGNRP
jgi:hypothetical protein